MYLHITIIRNLLLFATFERKEIPKNKKVVFVSLRVMTYSRNFYVYEQSCSGPLISPSESLTLFCASGIDPPCLYMQRSLRHYYWKHLRSDHRFAHVHHYWIAHLPVVVLGFT